MTPNTSETRSDRRKVLASAKAIAFVAFLSLVILGSFFAPHFFIQTLGNAEIHEVASRIANDNADWESKVNETMEQVNQSIKTSIYLKTQFSPFPGSNLHITPNYPYVYDRVLNPSWIMFFKSGACGEHGILFVEIARHAGVRARLVLNPGEDHAWAEVFIDNSWIPVDPTQNKFINPENYENERGKQMSYVYATEGDEVTDVTSKYTSTGRLVVRVEQNGGLVKGADVIVKSRLLVDSGENGYGAPQLAISSKTDENGTCVLELGGNNYQIIAEDGNYRAVKENIGLTEGDNVYLTLSLSATGVLALGDVLLFVLVAMLVTLGIILYKTKFSFKRFMSNLPKFRTDLHAAAGIFMITIALACAFIIIPVGFGGLSAASDSNSQTIMLLWMIFGFMGGLFSLLGCVLILRRGHLQQIAALVISTTAIGIIFWVMYGGFGFVVGAPIALLSTFSMILVLVSAKLSHANAICLRHEKSSSLRWLKVNPKYIVLIVTVAALGVSGALFVSGYYLAGYLIGVWVSICALGFTVLQAYMASKTLRGEAYEFPPLKKVGFIKPMPRYESDVKHDIRVRFCEMVENDSWIFKKVILPKNSKVRLAITWRTIEKQSLRHVQVGFELGHGVKPRIVRRVPWWRIKAINLPKPFEYIDLDGYYHIEYPNSRKFGKESAFIEGFEVETGGGGNYNLHVEIYSTEARDVFKKTLEVEVK